MPKQRRLHSGAILGAILTLALTPALVQDAPTRTLIRNVNIFDGRSDSLSSGMNVLVEPVPEQIFSGILRDYVPE